ncbi:L-lactate dehydrogenase [Thermohalobacter berrensis]|uniref:L-lactate dehydrogenase n=1 Tax=Thermohalobacter berrensis TaxID=99594 RepID=A0A419T7S3_9FIRM|nr:L-lactate dehydrogenase [Thermohalobacter berrensis]RKD33473.1 L-lactate dehydrogenase [Thermohalobacter berrensis]
MIREPKNKVVIIGTGYVGSTTAFTLMHSGLVSEMILIDKNKDKAEGEVMDLNHCLSFVKPMSIRVGNYSDCIDADIIIIAAGPSIKPGETRLDLADRNSKLIESIMKKITAYTYEPIIIIATNPVDILTYVAAKSVNYNKNKVIGSGTVLDSSRFRYLISKHCNIDTRNVHGYIIGEHGDSEVAVWSRTNIAGMNIDKYCERCNDTCGLKDKNRIFEEVRDAGYEILKRKDATYYGVSLAIRRITEAILRNENSILTVSSLLTGEYNLYDVSLSVPSIVNSNGIDKILEIPLSKRESELLKKSAKKLQDIIRKINYVTV